MLDKIEGRFLQTFLAVWEEQSFSRAAERLGYVQSTVTVHIGLMEEAVGEKLFVRLPRGVEPTEAGRKTAAFVYRWAQLARSFEEELKEAGEPAGIVRVRALESFSASRLPAVLHGFLPQYPRVKLALETGFLHDIAEAVRLHRADIGIVPRDPGHPELAFELLVEEALVCVAAPPLAERVARGGWTAAEDEPVLTFGSRCVYTTMAGQVLAAAGTQPPYAEFASVEMIRQTVAAGLGLAFLPESAVRSQLADGSLGSIPLERPILLQHGVITHRERGLGRAGRLFHEHLLSTLRSNVLY